jgi:hypothetical protein
MGGSRDPSANLDVQGVNYAVRRDHVPLHAIMLLHIALHGSRLHPVRHHEQAARRLSLPTLFCTLEYMSELSNTRWEQR